MAFLFFLFYFCSVDTGYFVFIDKLKKNDKCRNVTLRLAFLYILDVHDFIQAYDAYAIISVD